MKSLAIAFCLLMLPATALAQIAPETRWADPSYVVLDVQFPSDGYHANWELFRCCGDLLVHSELSIPGEAEVGELLMVQRRVVLSRGFGEHQQAMGGSLDAPALMMQLVLRLLERGEPGGPSVVVGELGVNVYEQIMDIMLDTGTAVGGFQAPWSVHGLVAPAGKTKRRFDLKFTFALRDANGERQVSMQLKGMADFAKLDFPLSGAEPLEGWTLFWNNENDPLQQQMKGVNTLEALRTLIREN